jgi:hypothetical protein
MRVRSYAIVLALAAIAAVAGLGATAAEGSRAPCNPNTGCLPRPVDVFEGGSGRYVVKPSKLVLETGGPMVYASGLRWSKWTGGYGRHGLISGSARGTGKLYGVDARKSDLGRVTIDLYDVRNGGVNAFTYYGRLRIVGGRDVAHWWHYSLRASEWVA